MDRPAIIAHRGYAGTYPENTVRAMEAASADPRTDGLEIDVRACRDGTPVVFHDERLDRRRDGSPGLTDSSGLVRECSEVTVTDAEVLGSGETIPRLETVCESIPAGTFVTVELKSPGDDDLRPDRDLDDESLNRRREVWQPFVDRVISILARYDLEVRLASFCQAAVAEAATGSFESAPICTYRNAEASVAFAHEHDCPAIHTDLRSIDGKSWLQDPDVDVVSAAMDTGLSIVGWTAQTWHDAIRMHEAGVDGITANYPSLLSAFEPGASSPSPSGDE